MEVAVAVAEEVEKGRTSTFENSSPAMAREERR
jgi:hypothetical protein